MDREMPIGCRLLSNIAALLRERDGSILPIFGFTIGIVAMTTGVAVDTSMFMSERSLVQQAADGAVLSAARLNDTDSARVQAATAFFNAHIPPRLTSTLSNKKFAIDTNVTKITASVDMSYKTVFAGVTNQAVLKATVTSEATIAKPIVRELDLVMCVDGTGSMTNTLNAVKTNALNFEKNMNDEISKRGIVPFEAMRVRVIFYRDYAGNYNGSDTYTTWVNVNGRWTTKTYTTSDPEYWSYMGDSPTIKASSFFSLPASRTDFSAYVNPETASGGGDLPEAGLECVNEAMNSPWSKVGDYIASVGKPLDAVFPVIVVWTDAAAHNAGYAPSLKNPSYPTADKMPRTTAGLRAKWMDANVIDQYRKLLVFFGNPSVSQSDYYGVATGWADVKTWPNFVVGGTLTQGNQQMVSRIADAIAAKIPAPFLSQ
jgi:Flp pilus assembly protein TadG